MTFRELKIGDEFDFIGPDRMLNSFYYTCRKISAHKYEWQQNEKWTQGTIGSVTAKVYHVNGAEA